MLNTLNTIVECSGLTVHLSGYLSFVTGDFKSTSDLETIEQLIKSLQREWLIKGDMRTEAEKHYCTLWREIDNKALLLYALNYLVTHYYEVLG